MAKRAKAKKVKTKAKAQPDAPARAKALRIVKRIEHFLREGYPPPGNGNSNKKIGAYRKAMAEAGYKAGSLSIAALARQIEWAGREPDWSLYREPEPESLAPLRIPSPVRSNRDLAAEAESILKKKPLSLDGLAQSLGVTRGAALDAVDAIKARHINLVERGDLLSLEKSQEPAFAARAAHEIPTYVSRADNTFLFGACGDNHLGNRNERLDVLNDLYDRYAAANVDCVFNTGNWIDGVAPFNTHELHTHGLDPQIAYLVANYPQRDGIVTRAVWGDDHEGWFAKREGIDVGAHAEHLMREAGREDWENLGFMEAHVRLVNANTGKEAIMAVVHPGGGSAYALSYSIQKIIEALEGGEKPAVGLYGHYHKLWAGNIRNVWCIQTGTSEDQTIFMRKKRLEAHVGGVRVDLEQDPETGAIVGCTPKLIRYFNRGYYNNRHSYVGPVAKPPRSVNHMGFTDEP